MSEQPTSLPPLAPPPPPVASPPSWHSTVTSILRALLGLWFLLLAWFGAFFGMLSDGCGKPCPGFERQILWGIGSVIVALVALFFGSQRIERRLSSLIGKVAVQTAAAIGGVIVLIVVGGVLSSLAPE